MRRASNARYGQPIRHAQDAVREELARLRVALRCSRPRLRIPPAGLAPIAAIRGAIRGRRVDHGWAGEGGRGRVNYQAVGLARSWRVWQRQWVVGGGGWRGGGGRGRKRGECPAGWWVPQPLASPDFAQDTSHRRRGERSHPPRGAVHRDRNRLHSQSGRRAGVRGRVGAAQLESRNRAHGSVTHEPTDATRDARAPGAQKKRSCEPAWAIPSNEAGSFIGGGPSCGNRPFH